MMGRLAALAVTAAAASGVYLPPTHSRGGALRYCPNLTGLERFSRQAVEAARADVKRYARVSLRDDLLASDPAWQPTVRAMWRRPGFAPASGPEFVLGPTRATPLGRYSYGVIVRYSCGTRILFHTLEFTVVPGRRSRAPTCDACRTTFFLLDRRGHPLIYYIH